MGIKEAVTEKWQWVQSRSLSYVRGVAWNGNGRGCRKGKVGSGGLNRFDDGMRSQVHRHTESEGGVDGYKGSLAQRSLDHCSPWLTSHHPSPPVSASVYLANVTHHSRLECFCFFCFSTFHSVF